MSDPYAKVQVGDPFEVPAPAWNSMLRLTQASKLDRLDTRTPAPTSTRSATIILLKNQTGMHLGRNSILGLDDPIFTPGATSEDVFLGPISYLGSIPDAKKHRRRYAVLVDPAPPDRVVRAVVAGVCQVRLDMLDKTHGYANITDGDVTHMTSSRFGHARILWDEDVYYGYGDGGGGGGSSGSTGTSVIVGGMGSGFLITGGFGSSSGGGSSGSTSTSIIVNGMGSSFLLTGGLGDSSGGGSSGGGSSAYDHTWAIVMLGMTGSSSAVGIAHGDIPPRFGNQPGKGAVDLYVLNGDAEAGPVETIDVFNDSAELTTNGNGIDDGTRVAVVWDADDTAWTAPAECPGESSYGAAPMGDTMLRNMTRLMPPNPDIVTSAEEYWTLANKHISQEDINQDAPQAQILIRWDNSGAHALFMLNFMQEPDFVPGGVQLAVYPPSGSAASESHGGATGDGSWLTEPFGDPPYYKQFVSGETCTWTVRVSLADDMITIEVRGTSPSFGDFDLGVSYPTTVTSLAAYSPDRSALESGVTFGGVTSIGFTVAWFAGSTKVAEDDLVREVYAGNP